MSYLSQSPVLAPIADSARQLQQGFSKFGPQTSNRNVTQESDKRKKSDLAPDPVNGKPGSESQRSMLPQALQVILPGLKFENH